MLCTAMLFATMSAAQSPPPTPNENDVPQPVPVRTSLAGEARPDIVRFLNIRNAVDPSLSPDGGTVAFRTRITGSPQLWTVASEGGWPRQLTFVESVTFHRWSPRGDWIVYGTDIGGNEREGYYLINPEGTVERELLTPSDAFRVFGGFTRDGRSIAYATTERNGIDFDIRMIDLETGRDREVFRGRMGLRVASLSPDGGTVILSEARGEDANDLYLLDVETGVSRVLFSPTVPSSYASITWAPDGAGFYLATDQDREFSTLAYYDLAQGQLGFIETPEHDVEQVALSPDGRYLAWVVNEGGYSRINVRDLIAGTDLVVPPLPPGLQSITWAERAPVAAIHVSGPQVPGDVWVWDVASGALRRATTSSAAGLDLSAMVVPTPVSFTASDGVVVHGLLYSPSHLPPGGKAPVLLAVHGGPTAQARPEFDAPFQYLLARGIAVLDLNYRGSTGYGKRYARLNDRHLRENELEDLRAAVRWLRGQPMLDGERVAIMGGSYGGYLAMAGMSRLPELFAAGVAFVGVSNWLTALQGASPALKASDRLEYGDVDDPRDREFFRRISPIAHVEGVRAPMLIVHGANDPRDPVTESDQFVAALRARGLEVEYLRFPDEGHGIRKLENRIIAYRRIAAFLERVLRIS